MANQEHVDLLNQGVEQWNAWREHDSGIQPDLNGVTLSDASLIMANLRSANLNDATLNCTDLSGATLDNATLNGATLNRAILNGTALKYAALNRATLSGAILNGASLRGANLSGAILNRANLSGAILNGASLRGANLSNTDLSNADLSNTDLSGATVRNATLNGACLSQAMMWGTIIAEVDFRGTKGLAEIQHKGLSLIHLPTVLLPQDGSSLYFLRGTGVPDEWIEDYRTHMMHPVQFHSLFISYSSWDDTLARRLHADLQDHGVRCWFAPEDLKIGDRFHSRIDEAIHVHDKLLLLLSQSAIKSDWVEIEVRAALEKEQRQHRDVLFPVRLDSSVMETSQAWAAMLRQSRHIGDFTNWTNPQAYQQAFDRLLRNLKKADEQQDQERKP